LGFPFEAVSNAVDRMAAMEALLDYCGYVAPHPSKAMPWIPLLLLKPD
jgi:hypothetical protein